MDLLISFPDQSKSFSQGVEYGRILERMQRGDESVQNDSFPVRIDNKSLIEKTCETYGYIPSFGETFYDEWIMFIGIKKTLSNN